jgi:predicted site-specific integrase-resolvase
MVVKETLNLETASERYDVPLPTLRLWCTSGRVKSTKAGKRRYVTPAEMDRVCKGVEAPEAKAILVSKKPTKKV